MIYHDTAPGKKRQTGRHSSESHLQPGAQTHFLVSAAVNCDRSPGTVHLRRGWSSDCALCRHGTGYYNEYMSVQGLFVSPGF